VGDDIRNADGTTGEVESIETEKDSQEMYNLTVDVAHTYYVGDGQWLVHNASCRFSTTDSILSYFESNGIARVSGVLPIPEQAAKSFLDMKYTSLVLEQPLDLFRVGTSGKPWGQYFSLEYPMSVLDARINQAILPIWPDGGISPLDTVYAWNFPQNTNIHLGIIKPQTPSWFYQGMTPQIFIHEPWKIPGTTPGGSWPLPNIWR